MKLAQLYTTIARKLKQHLLQLFIPLLILTLAITAYWNLSQQYQARWHYEASNLNTLKQNLLNIENRLNESLQNLHNFHLNVNFDIETLKTLMKAYALSTPYRSLSYASVLKQPDAFIKEMQQKGFESCQIHNHIYTPWEGETEIKKHLAYLPDKTDYLPIRIIMPYTPENTIHLCEDMTTFAQLSFLRPQTQQQPVKFYTLFVQHKYLNFPTLLQITPTYFHGKLQNVIIGEIDLQQLLANNDNNPSHQLQLLYNGHKVAHHKTPTPDTLFDKIALTEIQLKTPIQLFHKSFKLTYHTPWTLNQLNYVSLILSLLIATIAFTLIFFLSHQLIQHLDTLTLYQKRLQQLIHNAHDAIIITDQQGNIKTWSPAAESLFGYTQPQAQQQPFCFLFFLTEKEMSFSQWIQDIQKQTEQSLLFKNKKGEPIHVKLSTTPIQIGEELEYFFEIYDITHEIKQTKRIEQLAYYDTLTGLENRTLFKQNIDSLLKQEPNLSAAMLFLDLDGFKQVNDTLGHKAGDELLKVIALRLRGFINHIDRYHHLCRFGGDEFLIFIPYENQQALENLTQRILKSLQRPIHITQSTISVSASIGIALCPKDGNSHDLLIRRADSAMYAAKNEGKNTFAFYQEQMEEQLNEQIQIEQALKTAINNHELFLVYQPKIDAHSYRLKGFEALIRWIHPELGFVPPDKFIAIAEETDLINSIGDWVIQTALNQLQAWKEHPQLKNIPIAVNLSSKQITSATFFERLAETCTKHQVTTDQLELELTERSIMTNVQSNLQPLQVMQTLGFKMAIDDFGTGYSSLSYLKTLPIHTLKIDKSFVDGLPQDEHDKAITQTIINLAQNLNFQIVAEGVETQEQLEFLKKTNCQTIQGYYFSKPLKTSEIENWLQQHQRTYSLS